jgi:hypothetical protein
VRPKQPVSCFAHHIADGVFFAGHRVFPIARCFQSAQGRSTTASLVLIAAAASGAEFAMALDTLWAAC